MQYRTYFLNMEIITQLNKTFQNQTFTLFETHFLEKFKEETGKDLFIIIPPILHPKTQKQQRNLLLSQIIEHMQNINEFQQTAIKLGLQSGKKTTINKAISRLLISNDKGRIFLEQKRIEVIEKLRKGQKLKGEEIQLFQFLVQVFLQQKFQYENMSIDSGMASRNIKLLTCLRRNMILGCQKIRENKPDSVRKEQGKRNYYINRDIKRIFKRIIDKYEGVPTIEKFKRLMMRIGNSKWFGPRMYRLLSQEGWTNIELEVLKRILTTEKINFRLYVSDCYLLRVTFSKIKRNLRKHIVARKGSKLELISNFTEQRQQNPSIFDLHLLPSQQQQNPKPNMDNTSAIDQKRGPFIANQPITPTSEPFPQQ